MQTPLRACRLVALAFASFAIFGCTPLAFRSAPVPIPPDVPVQAAGMLPAAPRHPDLPVGRYRGVPASVPVVLAVEPGGEFLAFSENEPAVAGKFAAANGHITVEMPVCGVNADPAHYEWIEQEDFLRFSPIVPDACAERRQLLQQVFQRRLDLR